MKDLKVVHEDDHSVTLAHPSGHKVHIAKAGLSPGKLKELSSLAAYADGGEVEEEEEKDPVPPGMVPEQELAVASEPTQENAMAPVMGSGNELMDSPAQEVIEQAPIMQSAPVPKPVSDYDKSLQDLMSANTEEANTQKKLGTLNAADYEGYKRRLVKIDTEYDEKVRKIDGIIQTTKENMHDIDPSHYMQHKDTGQKVAIGIGLILGGLGGGGSNNQVLDMLNKQIDRDIDAQRDNLGKQKSLLEANYRELGDINIARAVTKAQALDILGKEIMLNAEKYRGPEKMATAMKANAALQFQSQNIVAKAKQEAAQKAQSLAGADDLTMKIEGLQDKDEKRELRTERGKHEAKMRAVNNVKDIFKQYGKTQTFKSRVLSPKDSWQKVDRLNASLNKAIMAASPSKKLNEEQAEQLVKPYYVDLTDSNDEVQDKLRAVLNIIKTNADPTPGLIGRKWVADDTSPVDFQEDQ